MESELSFDMDDEDIDSDESSKEAKVQKNDSYFCTENIINYGKEYEKLEKLYSKKEIISFNKLLEFKNIIKLNKELNSYKKEKINWKYLYENFFKMILLPINLNKIDINKTITIYEISHRIRYCVNCISSIKDKDKIINEEKKNIIPKVIDIFLQNNKKSKILLNINKIKKSYSHQNFKFGDEDDMIKNNNLNNNNIKVINNNKNNNKDILKNIQNNNNNKNENNNIRSKGKNHMTIIIGKKSQEKLYNKNPLIDKEIKENNNNEINNYKKNIIFENITKKNEGYDNSIKNIPKLSDDILFEINQKKTKISLKRDAFMETLNDFNLKNNNLEIKDKTFCDNFYFFPLKQNYDKENDLEKRGEKILSYKKMADNLIDLLNV